MDLNSFYGKDFDLTKNKISIDYHIIYINDERKSNREDIDSYLNGNKHNIKSLNARNEIEKENFFNENKDFKLGWDSFKVGELGNFASHYLAWKYVDDNNLDSLLVFEDDAKIILL
jgi:GR25 family glycosyltransferase involved in LPS biosynthesis